MTRLRVHAPNREATYSAAQITKAYRQGQDDTARHYEAAVDALEHARKYANRIYEQHEWSESDLLEIIHAADDALARLREQVPA